MKELISIIVPVYKVEKYLPRCIESVLSQTYKNFELILVDDGSPDKSGEICDGYAKKDERIKVIHKENGGVSSARNAGIDAAKGEYIAFIDSDDYVDPTMYEKLYAKIIEGKDIVFCYFYREFPNGKIETYTDNSKDSFIKTPWDIRPMLCGGVVLYGEKIELINCGAWRSLYRKEIIDKFNLRFNEKLKMGEDRLFLISYLNQCETAGLVQEPLYHYIKEREGSACTSNANNIAINPLHEQEKYLEKKKQVLNSTKMSDKEKQELIDFIRVECFLNFVRANLISNKSYRKVFKDWRRQKECKEILGILNSKTIKNVGCGFKENILASLFKLRLYWIAKILMN